MVISADDLKTLRQIAEGNGSYNQEKYNQNIGKFAEYSLGHVRHWSQNKRKHNLEIRAVSRSGKNLQIQVGEILRMMKNVHTFTINPMTEARAKAIAQIRSVSDSDRGGKYLSFIDKCDLWKEMYGECDNIGALRRITQDASYSADCYEAPLVYRHDGALVRNDVRMLCVENVTPMLGSSQNSTMDLEEFCEGVRERGKIGKGDRYKFKADGLEKYYNKCCAMHAVALCSAHSLSKSIDKSVAFTTIVPVAFLDALDDESRKAAKDAYVKSYVNTAIKLTKDGLIDTSMHYVCAFRGEDGSLEDYISKRIADVGVPEMRIMATKKRTTELAEEVYRETEGRVVVAVAMNSHPTRPYGNGAFGLRALNAAEEFTTRMTCGLNTIIASSKYNKNKRKHKHIECDLPKYVDDTATGVEDAAIVGDAIQGQHNPIVAKSDTKIEWVGPKPCIGHLMEKEKSCDLVGLDDYFEKNPKAIGWLLPSYIDRRGLNVDNVCIVQRSDGSKFLVRQVVPTITTYQGVDTHYYHGSKKEARDIDVSDNSKLDASLKEIENDKYRKYCWWRDGNNPIAWLITLVRRLGGLSSYSATKETKWKELGGSSIDPQDQQPVRDLERGGDIRLHGVVSELGISSQRDKEYKDRC